MKDRLHGRYGELILLGGLTLLALALRLWWLDSVPPGWRDDELINVLVISQKVLAGDWAIYFADASGHEGLYHTLAAGVLRLFGFTAVGIRGLSVLAGTLTVPLTYLVGRRLFSSRFIGFVAALALTFSFWSLMYSRIGLRHISVVVFTLLAFYFVWRGLQKASQSRKSDRPKTVLISFGLAGLFLGLNFYTYFASRGVPLILLAFFIYLALFQRPLFRQSWRGFLLLGGVMAALALPLIITLNQQPEAEARVAELAAPLIEASEGDFSLLGEHIVRTLSMFHSDGDDEWLYNIPFRPVFGPIGAVFFWAGVVIAVWRTVEVVRGRDKMSSDLTAAAYPFVLVWWLVGIAPGFVSVPAASLGHTIVAQSAVYLLAALPIGIVFQAYRREREYLSDNRSLYQRAVGSRWVSVALALLFVGTIGWRDTADYFNEWPNRGLTRFLYRADIKALAHYLADYPELIDFGITSLLAGPWDKEAFKVDLAETTVVSPRWYNPERAILLAIDGKRPLSFSGYPNVPVLYEDWYEDRPDQKAGDYQLAEIDSRTSINSAEKVCFQNGLCWLATNYDQTAQTLEMVWSVERSLLLPEAKLISNPPPPGVYAGPRLLVFGQLLDSEENFLAGDDGFWVDPYSLQVGDVFLQQHRPLLSDGQQPAFIVLGLYDPMTDERILTEDGRDHVRMEIK